MKYFLLIVVSLILFSCKKTCEKCLNKEILTHSKQVGYDFYMQSDTFFDYLISIGLINKYDKSSLLKFIEEEKYCLVNYEQYIQEVDNTFATSPIIGGAYVNCIKKYDLPCDLKLSIDFDSLATSGKGYFKSMLSKLDENDLNNVYVKLFLFYELNVLMGVCPKVSQ